MAQPYWQIANLFRFENNKDYLKYNKQENIQKLEQCVHGENASISMLMFGLLRSGFPPLLKTLLY